MKVLIDEVEYRPKTVADELPDNWQELLVKRIIESGRSEGILTDDLANPFERATGRKYTSKEMCINDLRRFFLVCLTSCPLNLEK